MFTGSRRTTASSRAIASFSRPSPLSTADVSEHDQILGDRARAPLEMPRGGGEIVVEDGQAAEAGMGPRGSGSSSSAFVAAARASGERRSWTAADGDLVDAVAASCAQAGTYADRSRAPGEERGALRETLGGPLLRELDGLEVERVGLGVGLARLGSHARDLEPKLLDDVGGDLVLDREDVVEGRS